MTLGPRLVWTSWIGSRASITACEFIRQTDTSPQSQESAASWLHDLLYVETRQGHNGHEPYAYLKDVLERLPSQPASALRDLLPYHWTPAG